MNQNNILKNNGLDERLLQEGYVVVPFLNPSEVDDLKRFFFENCPEKLPSFYATAHATDVEFRKRMNEKIKTVFANSFDKYFNNCKALGGSYIVKNKEGSVILKAHQDWNIVDETQFRSFNIWVPLLDLSAGNGAISVLPKSHLWVENFRGPNISDAFEAKTEMIWKEMTTLEMKAGEALIYDHRLFHASHANLSDEPRIACVFGIVPEEATMFYYFGNGNKIEIYESNVEFFMNGNIQKGHKILKKLKEVNVPQIDVDEIDFFKSRRKSKSFFRRLFS
jgi:hypothetical protein